MRRRAPIAIAFLLGIAAAGAGAAALQETATELRATGFVGEQYDGYLGVVGSTPPRLRAQMDAVNIRRRAHYTELARLRRARVEEVGVAAACEILATRVGPGQYYLLPDGVWRRRQGTEPVPRPAYCR
jgi:uncharacterized protein YdbL (DUF1318 family)